MIEITNTDLAEAFEKLSAKLAKPDYIVAVPRGGLYLAQYLSYYFELPKDRILLALNKDDIIKNFENLSKKEFYKLNILVCDDIYDTGNQFNLFEDFDFATLFARARSSKLPENLQYGTLIKSDEYLHFPWDFEI